jgi:D-beta-D-heptose 7-phosphate kinase/D-beta-D-heptose 1-phosphate adenosyltransferase
MDEITSRALDSRQLTQTLRTLRKQGCRIVFTNGCFDVLHVGHIRYLKQARALGDVLIVGLNSDSSVRKLKGHDRPIIPEEERTEVLLALECVDYVTIFSEDTPYELIKKVVPDVLVKGGDWSIDRIVGRDIVEANGGKVLSLPFHPGKSSSDIIGIIKTKL